MLLLLLHPSEKRQTINVGGRLSFFNRIYLLLVEKPNGLAIASNLSILNATRTNVEPYVTRHCEQNKVI